MCKYLKNYGFCLLPLFLAVLCSKIGAETHIEKAFNSGHIDQDSALLYALSWARDWRDVPKQFQQKPDRPFCGTTHVIGAMSAIHTSNSSFARKIAKRVQRRPTATNQIVSPSGNFRVHYDIKGPDAVENIDNNLNGIPDWIDVTMQVLDGTWTLQIDSLGYKPPPNDGGNAGEEYDVYIVDLGRGGAYGFTYPERFGNTSSSYLELDNDYSNSIYQQTRGTDALRVTIAHEFNHAIQFGYYQGSDGIWWQESTSTWMEEVAYPEVNDYLQYLESFLGVPHRSLFSGNRFGSDFHIYGSSIFSHFLGNSYGDHINRLIWEELARQTNARLEHFNRVLLQFESNGFSKAIGDFGVWNYFTGKRFQDGFYPEGHLYPLVPIHEIAIDESLEEIKSEDVLDATGTRYFRILPQLRSGGISINFDSQRGQWQKNIFLVTRDSAEVKLFNGTEYLLQGWDRFEEIVVSVTSSEESGFAYPFTLRTLYDPKLTDGVAADVSLFHPPSPNPFRSENDSYVRFIFDLDHNSLETTVVIFTLAGEQVWSKKLGPSIARKGYEARWDGRALRNSSASPIGKSLASGIYFVMIQTDRRRLYQTFAFINDVNK